MREMKLTKLVRLALLPAVAAGLSVSAQAQTPNTNTTSAQQRSAAPGQTAQRTNYRGVRASEVIGMKVRNEKGENLGEIGDLVINVNTGEVRYSILRFDPGIFSGERLFAVPTKDLRMAPDRNEVVYRMDKERLEQAAIERRDWNRTYLSDRARMSGFDRAWGIRQPSEQATAYRASDLIDKEVKNRNGEEVGELEDLIIDMANQRVHYAVMEYDSGWLGQDKRAVLPLRSFSLAPNEEDLRLDSTKQQAQSTQDFKQDNYANLNNPVWLVQVDRYLVTTAPAGTDRSVSGAGTRSDMQAQGASPRAGSDTRAAGATGAQQGQQSSAAGTQHSAEYKQSMDKLQQSAQRLRESIQAMAQKPAGEDRETAIEAAHEALRETQRAMIALPTEAREEAVSSRAAGRANAEYDKSVKKLMNAADSLRKSIQSMAQQPPGDARNKAIEQANKALLDTQQAMVSAYEPARASSSTMGASGQQQKR